METNHSIFFDFLKKNATANLQWILASCYPVRCIGYLGGCGISSIVSSAIYFDWLSSPIHGSNRLNFWDCFGPNFGWTRNNFDWDDFGWDAWHFSGQEIKGLEGQ